MATNQLSDLGTKVVVWTLFVFYAVSSSASPVDLKKCVFLLNGFQNKTRTYVKEVKESPYYSRVFIKEKSTDSSKVEKDYLGFLPKTDPDAESFLFSVVPNPEIIPRWLSKKVLSESRDFKPSTGLKTIANKILAKSANATFLKHFSDPEISGLSSFFIDILVATGSGFFIYDVVGPLLKGAYVDFDILTDPAWANTIRYDYRYFYIKQKIRSHAVSNFGGLKEAHLLNLSYKKYYEYMIKDFPKDDYLTMKKQLHFISTEIQKDLPKNDLDLALFSTVFWFIDHGVQSTDAYGALNPGPISLEQEEDLFKIYNSLYLSYQLVSQWVWKNQKTSNEALDMIVSRPHSQKLISYFKSGKLSRLQLLYFMGFDLHFETYYKELDILQIVPFRIHDHKITDEFNTDTLEDLQAQIDQNIENQVGMP